VRKISANTDHPLDPDAVVLRRALRSCPGFELVRVLGSDSLKYTFALYGPGIAFLLASLHPGYLRAFGQGLLGTDDVPLRLDDPEAIKEWVRLHTWSMTRSNEEYALCLDRYDQLPLDPLVEPDPEVRDRLRAHWIPMTVSAPRDDDPEGLVARVATTTLHEARVAYAHFTVSRDGEVELDESEEDVDRLPLDEARLGRLLAMPPLGMAGTEDVPVGAAADAAHAGGGS
jgi:hypothetical protein